MKKNKKIAIVAAILTSAALPLFAGSWFNSCVEHTSFDGDRDNCGVFTAPDVKNSNKSLVCAVSNSYYDPGANMCTPTICNGFKLIGGKCVQSQWGWSYCATNSLNGFGTKFKITGECAQAYNPDGSIRMFYFPCSNMRVGDMVSTIRTECTVK